MRVALLGLGVVGKALLREIFSRGHELKKRYGLNLKGVGVSDSKNAIYNEDGLDLNDILRLKEEGRLSDHPNKSSVEELIRGEADVLVELTPTNLKDGMPAIKYIKDALSEGKHVITANKGPLALEMPALMELADYNGVHLLFSGSVGGGTPFIRFMERCLLGERIVRIRGVINGTTNYILTKMEEGYSLNAALSEAQRLGYAEADPSMDVDGWDSAAKLVILSNVAFQSGITIKDIEISGIRDISLEDVQGALAKKRTYKLVAYGDGDLHYVRLEQIDLDSPLNVRGALNSLEIEAELSGRHTLIGKGAGGRETAAAILRDMVELKRRITGGSI